MRDLRHLIEASMAHSALVEPNEVITVFPEEPPDTSCRPFRVRCSDDGVWYLKGSHLGRIPVTEQVVARMAMLIGAPVPEVAVVRLREPEASAFSMDVSAGLYHGSREIPRANLVYWVRPRGDNLPDIAGLDVLYAWAESGDEQYLIDADDRYYSFDHGAFLPGGPEWSINSLRSARPPQRFEMFERAAVAPKFYAPILERLASVDERDVATVVGAHPAEWECSVDERVALAEYFLSRRELALRLFREQS